MRIESLFIELKVIALRAYFCPSIRPRIRYEIGLSSPLQIIRRSVVTVELKKYFTAIENNDRLRSKGNHRFGSKGREKNEKEKRNGSSSVSEFSLDRLD